jgi:hypothetical protein
LTCDNETGLANDLRALCAGRINSRRVRDAFLREPIESYTAAHDLRVWTGTW